MPTDPSVWKDHLDKGRKALEEGRLAGACAELTLALEIAEEFEPGDPRLLETLNYLGYAFYKQRNDSGAEELFRRALAHRQQVLAPDHPDIAENLHWLATVCRSQGKDEEAEALTLRELETRKKALGPAPAPMAGSLDNRTHCYWFRLVVRERALGPEHPEITHCLKQLEYVLWSAYDGDDRELLWRQVAEILRQLYQRRDKLENGFFIDVVGSLHRTLANLACLAYQRGQHDEAERLMRQMYETVQEGYGPKSAAASSALSDLPTFPMALLQWILGKSYAGAGSYAEAEPWFQRALGECEKDLPRLNRLLADTLRGYADLCRKTGREEEASQLEERARIIAASEGSCA
jgi:tetratricopeptide (TPR) repeat protein